MCQRYTEHLCVLSSQQLYQVVTVMNAHYMDEETKAWNAFPKAEAVLPDSRADASYLQDQLQGWGGDQRPTHDLPQCNKRLHLYSS